MRAALAVPTVLGIDPEMIRVNLMNSEHTRAGGGRLKSSDNGCHIIFYLHTVISSSDGIVSLSKRVQHVSEGIFSRISQCDIIVQHFHLWSHLRTSVPQTLQTLPQPLLHSDANRLVQHKMTNRRRSK